MQDIVVTTMTTKMTKILAGRKLTAADRVYNDERVDPDEQSHDDAAAADGDVK